MGDVDLKRTPEGNNKVRRNVSIERSQLSCAEWLWGSHRTQVTLGAQPACACCLKWPTDPLSACSSSGLPRRASAGGRRGESKRGLDTREGGKKAKARDARNWERGGGGGAETGGGEARNFSAVWGLAQRLNRSSLELAASRSALPANDAAQTSVNARPRMRKRSDVSLQRRKPVTSDRHCSCYREPVAVNWAGREGRSECRGGCVTEQVRQRGREAIHSRRQSHAGTPAKTFI